MLEGRRSLPRTRAIGSFHSVFSLNSILKSFSVDPPPRDKLDFYFLWRENNVIYLILHLSLSQEHQKCGLFSLNASFFN